MSDFKTWFGEQPFTTKWLTVFSLVIPLLMKFRLITPHYLVWHWESITRGFQIWRIITPVFLTAVNFNFILALYFRYRYSSYLELDYFANRSADYFYFITLSILMINVANCFIHMAALWESLSMAIVYVWAMNNRQVIVNFMFGIKFPAVYLPIVLGLLEFLMAGDLFGPLVGILVGHAYYFLSEVYSRTNPRWRTRLQAPAWLSLIIPKQKPSAGSASYQGFTVQKPDEAFGGRANASMRQKDSASASGFSPFGGKSQKLGT